MNAKMKQIEEAINQIPVEEMKQVVDEIKKLKCDREHLKDEYCAHNNVDEENLSEDAKKVMMDFIMESKMEVLRRLYHHVKPLAAKQGRGEDFTFANFLFYIKG